MTKGKDTGPEAGAKGIVEGAKGKVKEAAGALTGKEGRRDEGRAQQSKGCSSARCRRPQGKGRRGPPSKPRPTRQSSGPTRGETVVVPAGPAEHHATSVPTWGVRADGAGGASVWASAGPRLSSK